MRKWLALFLFAFIAFSCQKEVSPADFVPGAGPGPNPGPSKDSLATVTTAPITSITDKSASGGGIVAKDGGATVTARGICWSATANPTIASTHTSDGTGTGAFTSNLSSLTAATTYHVRAYATNSVGTAYGNDISFTTAAITPPPPPPPPPTSTNGDTYVAGFRFISGLRSAQVWKNGVATPLTNGTFETQANEVVVSGTDVYVAGTSSVNSLPKAATIWKNGVVMPITTGSGSSQADALFVSGSNVYAAGLKGALPTVWVNGTPNTLEVDNNAGLLVESAYSIYVANGNIYVAGGENGVAMLWVNGAATHLTSGANDAQAYAVVGNGSDVYVTGFEENATHEVAKVWKNGVATSLSNGSADASGLSIFLSGTDVYVAGYDGDNAVLWKNGVETILATDPVDAMATSVYVSGSDVYVLGHKYVYGPGIIPQLWKNGTLVPFAAAAADGYAYSLFVK